MPPANVLGGGELVSRCAHVAGFKGFGTGAQLLRFAPSRYREQGCGWMSQAFSGGTKGASAHVCSRGRSPPGESPAADAGRDPACMGSILHP